MWFVTPTISLGEEDVSPHFIATFSYMFSPVSNGIFSGLRGRGFEQHRIMKKKFH